MKQFVSCIAVSAMIIIGSTSSGLANPGDTWGPGGITDTKEWVCKPIKNNPGQQRCTRR